MEKIASVKEFQKEILKDLYNAEVLTVSELLYFKNRVDQADLKELIQNYLYHCRSHITALEELLGDSETSYFDDHCRTMKSLIRESQKLVDKCSSGKLRNLAVVTGLQRISTCKKTAYRLLLNTSQGHQEKQYLNTLNQILKEEYDMEEILQRWVTENSNLKEPAI